MEKAGLNITINRKARAVSKIKHRHTINDEREYFKRINDSFYLITFNTKEDLTTLNMFVLRDLELYWTYLPA